MVSNNKKGNSIKKFPSSIISATNKITAISFNKKRWLILLVLIFMLFTQLRKKTYIKKTLICLLVILFPIIVLTNLELILNLIGITETEKININNNKLLQIAEQKTQVDMLETVEQKTQVNTLEISSDSSSSEPEKKENNFRKYVIIGVVVISIAVVGYLVYKGGYWGGGTQGEEIVPNNPADLPPNPPILAPVLEEINIFNPPEITENSPILQTNISNVPEVPIILEESIIITNVPEILENLPVLESTITNVPEIPENLPVLESTITNVPEIPENLPVLEGIITNVPEIPENLPVLEGIITNVPEIPENLPVLEGIITNVPEISENISVLENTITNVQEVPAILEESVIAQTNSNYSEDSLVSSSSTILVNNVESIPDQLLNALNEDLKNKSVANSTILNIITTEVMNTNCGTMLNLKMDCETLLERVTNSIVLLLDAAKQLKDDPESLEDYNALYEIILYLNKSKGRLECALDLLDHSLEIGSIKNSAIENIIQMKVKITKFIVNNIS